MRSPYWLAHAHQTHGTIMNLQGAPALAADSLQVAVGLMADCGDLSCWANSARGLARAELALGRPEHAAELLVEVIDALPVLPMQEIALPRTLDTTASTLAALGDLERAATVLGRAVEVPFEIETIRPRGTVHDEVRALAESGLGGPAFSAAMERGAALDDDEALALARAALAG
ncbi:MAG: hypothetical protein HKN46_11155 [Acidimicrobiia bacterium]|nr:hypothetical protein [Acidimicrobiia bacterium]